MSVFVSFLVWIISLSMVVEMGGCAVVFYMTVDYNFRGCLMIDELDLGDSGFDSVAQSRSRHTGKFEKQLKHDTLNDWSVSNHSKGGLRVGRISRP